MQRKIRIIILIPDCLCVTLMEKPNNDDKSWRSGKCPMEIIRHSPSCRFHWLIAFRSLFSFLGCPANAKSCQFPPISENANSTKTKFIWYRPNSKCHSSFFPYFINNLCFIFHFLRHFIINNLTPLWNTRAKWRGVEEGRKQTHTNKLCMLIDAFIAYNDWIVGRNCKIVDIIIPIYFYPGWYWWWTLNCEYWNEPRAKE